MKTGQKHCLKCGRPVSANRWLCPACRLENRNIANEAEGVSDLYGEDN